MNIPILDVMLTKDRFSKMKKYFPAHELPIWLANWGAENLEILGKLDDNHNIDDIDQEVQRMVYEYGEPKLADVFGANYPDGIEMSINKILSKEKKIDGNENASKSKNGVSAKTRV